MTHYNIKFYNQDVEVEQERVNSTLNRTISIAQVKAKAIDNVTSCQVYKIEQAFNEINEVFEEEEAWAYSLQINRSDSVIDRTTEE